MHGLSKAVVSGVEQTARIRPFYVFSSLGSMDGPWEDESDGLHELITRSLVHRRDLWALVLATYRVELTQLLDHAAKNSFGSDDRALVIDLAIRIAAVAEEIELAAMHADAISLRNHAAIEPESEVGERHILIAGLRLIERILESERVRKTEEQATESARPN